MSEPRCLRVELGARGYPILIGAGLLGEAGHYLPGIGGRQALIVTDETVAPLYLEPVRGALATLDCEALVLPDGEEHKTLATVNRIFDTLLAKRFDRRCTLVALGGGVIGDITGFAAACYQRGVDFIQVPTTLLAQVDSSVGGKTGVNHPLGKNMIGAFHQPRRVIADTAALDTLDDRQVAAGLAEVIKYGLIMDAEFFGWIEENLDPLMRRDPAALAHAIEHSCRCKARIVAADEREQGRRALLNLGHTFGHAIETAVGYGNWLHGEAVAAGTCLAARLSLAMGWLASGELERIERVMAAAGLPTEPPADLAGEQMLELMAVDKKVQDGVQRLVLLRAVGEAVVSADFDPAALRAVLGASGG